MNQVRLPYIKFPHRVIVKAPGLLPMLYTFRELAEELELPSSTLRDWLERGAPHERDERKHLWINGQAFSEWVNQKRRPKRQPQMVDDEAYCLSCKQAVHPLATRWRAIAGKLGLLTGECPKCGGQVHRGVRNG